MPLSKEDAESLSELEEKLTEHRLMLVQDISAKLADQQFLKGVAKELLAELGHAPEKLELRTMAQYSSEASKPSPAGMDGRDKDEQLLRRPSTDYYDLARANGWAGVNPELFDDILGSDRNNDDSEVAEAQGAERQVVNHMKSSLSLLLSGDAHANVRIASHKHWAVRLAIDHRFDAVCSVMIVMYSIILGVEVQYTSAHAAPALTFLYLNMFFTLVFVLELAIRLLAFGLKFFSGADWCLNVLDLLAVLLSVVEFAFGMMLVGTRSSFERQGGNNKAILRMARIVRIVRVFRLVRLMRSFSELRILVGSVMCSCRALVWALALLIIVLYVFAILFTQGIVDHLKYAEESEGSDVLNRSFGSLYRTSMTLYASVFGAVAWYDLLWHLHEVSYIYVVLFISFIAFTLIAVMNVVTGVFVQSAITSAQADVNNVIQEELAAEKSATQKLKSLFSDADVDEDGILTKEEFQVYLEDERVIAYLRHMGLEMDRVEGFFRLIDIDGRGAVQIDEFIMGCLRLQGGAKNVDVATLLYEQKRMINFLRDYFKKLLKDVGKVRESLRKTDDRPLISEASHVLSL